MNHWYLSVILYCWVFMHLSLCATTNVLGWFLCIEKHPIYTLLCQLCYSTTRLSFWTDPCLMEKLFAHQRLLLSVSLDEVTKVDKDKETRCLEKKKAWRGEEQQKLDAGRSVSHGRPGTSRWRKCTSPEPFLPFSYSQAEWTEVGGGSVRRRGNGRKSKTSEPKREMLHWILMSDQSWAERWGDLSCQQRKNRHLYQG